ncbi:hypothetical protein [uncultured Sphingomonas sp.]|uniref:hypothetical protein n=1 Tax=uncultured Sphingomonas sp. TaxID=158754 RepID=UPI0035CC1160
MDASFSITADPARDLIVMRLSGFFTPADLARLVAERQRVYATLHCGPNQHRTLSDTSRISIQSQDMVARFGAMLTDPTYHSRRLALITASSLARMQLQRAIGKREARVFTVEAEAMAWLFADDVSAAA